MATLTGFVLTETNKDRLNAWVADMHARNGDPVYWLPGGVPIYQGVHAGKWFVSWGTGTRSQRLKHITPRVRQRMGDELKYTNAVDLERKSSLAAKSALTVQEISDILAERFPALIPQQIDSRALVDPTSTPPV